MRESNLREPKISVVIPAYNASAYISDALNSVFAQTFADLEVVVVNDGSPDTPALESVLQPYRDRIRYLQQDNRGPSAARNLGITQARGEFVAFIDSDDVWLPEYLSEQMKLLDAQPPPDVVCADMSTYGNSAVHPTTLSTENAAGGVVSLKDLLLLNYVLLPSATVARRTTLVGAGLFDETIVRGEDWDLWMRLAYQGGRILCQKKVLGRRRVHSGGLTRDAWKTLKDEVRILTKWQKMEDLPAEFQQILREKLAQVNAYVDLEEGKQLVKSGEAEKGRAALERAYAFFGQQNLQERAMSTGPVTNGPTHAWLRRNKLRLLLAGLRYSPGFTIWAMKRR